MISSRSECFKRLSKANIKTVMDLLTINAINPKRLKEILNVRQNIWKVIIDHAQMCKDDKKGIYLYHHPNDEQKSNGVVFNMSGQLAGLITESNFVPCDKLPCDKLPYDKKADAQDLIVSSSEHWDRVVSFNNLASLINDFLPNTTVNSFGNSLNVEIPTIVTTPIFPIRDTNNQSNLGYDNIVVTCQSQSPKRPASEQTTSISPKKPRDDHFSMSPSTPSVFTSRMTNTNFTGMFNESQKPNNLLTPAISEDDDWLQFLDFSQYAIRAQRWISIFSKVRKRRMSFCDQLLQTSDDDETVFVIAASIEHVQS